MPHNVLNNVSVDYQVPISEMGYVLADIFSKPKLGRNMTEVPAEVKIESEITERMATNIDDLKNIGNKSNYSCPDCGGALWEMKNDAHPRYRCFTGHVYTGESLLEKQAEGVEESVLISIRMLEERKNLLKRLRTKQAEMGLNDDDEEDRLSRVEDLEIHINRLKALLVSIGKSNPKTAGYE